jgi:hypothetical protein
MQDNNQFRDDRFLQDEWTAFVHEVTTEDLTPQPAVADFDDSAWRNFQKSCEIDAAIAELSEAEEQTPRPRLRSERGDGEPQEDFAKSAGIPTARQRVAILEFAKRRIASGESLSQLIADSGESTATVLRQLIADGEL